ncbi:hypothetical protein GWK08_04150 [Leptobacterium flavescens]|uniref:Transcription regulator BetR N-terminal domain-containing protein n=1 Tax=Leptobacterium flavescens TaxID=472055 RepID=A0A6P0UJP3_9FLAO|nr:hypothetical protein [Leptobacterium flavescens]NER12620.1 hypothetical protein [Leptobacterium flavescens]
MYQTQLLSLIRKKIADDASLIEAIAGALDISYDAAHRRSSLKSKFSLEESVLLARHFDISLDRLFEVTDTRYVAVEKTKPINNEQELEEYFINSCQSLEPILKKEGCSVLYSAKDIPLFYTVNNDLLGKFKLYVWLKLLSPGFSRKGFEEFKPGKALTEAAMKLGELYKKVAITEIWDITTVNSTLKQIHFYHAAGQISTENALALCKSLKKLIREMENKVNANREDYQLYYNELLLMNNNVLVNHPYGQLLFIPFSILSYYSTSDSHTCRQAEGSLKKQLQQSKLLNTSGEKERNYFFNKIYTKIDALHQLLEASLLLDFE